MNYLLDTNAVVALLRNKPTAVRERYREAEDSGDYLAVSSVVLFELWYGAEKSTQVRENTERLRISSPAAWISSTSTTRMPRPLAKSAPS